MRDTAAELASVTRRIGEIQRSLKDTRPHDKHLWGVCEHEKMLALLNATLKDFVARKVQLERGD
jgi:hypothetical protein